MCGIVGIWSFDKRVDLSLLKKMKTVLQHRGSDDNGVYLDEEDNIGFAHTRLSIIDLSEKARQPMIDKELNIVIVYNGEIYNYKEIRNELQKLGYRFFSNSDTEVILKSYSEWGEKCLNKLRGMFAFCIFDRRRKELFLARDRFGIKPLYYYYNNNKFVFASEIKAILLANINKDVNLQGVGLFLSLGYIPSPKTIYREILSLEPGHFLKVSKDGIKKFKYYDLKEIFFKGEDDIIPFEKAVERTRDVLLESMKYHLISDVEVGAFLSGGIDSSSIVALMRQTGHERIKTVSVIFPNIPEYDEGKYARIVADKFGTEHLEVEVKGRDLIEHLDKIFYFMDQPTVDGVNTYFVSLAAKKAGLKTILSGLGGDEIFGGYPSFKEVPRLCKFLKVFNYVPFNSWLLFLPMHRRQKISSLLKNKPLSFVNTYLVYRGLFTPEEIKKILLPDLANKILKSISFDNFSVNNIECEFNKISFLEIYFYMSGQLLRDTDVFSMAHSLEIRVPFVDHKVIESLTTIPCSCKTDNQFPKRLLVKAIGELPKVIIDRRKMGFTLPFARWLKEEMMKEIEAELKKTTIFNQNYINQLLRLFWEGKIHWSRIWSLFVLSRFWKV